VRGEKIAVYDSLMRGWMDGWMDVVRNDLRRLFVVLDFERECKLWSSHPNNHCQISGHTLALYTQNNVKWVFTNQFVIWNIYVLMDKF